MLAKLRELGRNHEVIVTKYHGSISDIFFCPCSLNYGKNHGKCIVFNTEFRGSQTDIFFAGPVTIICLEYKFLGPQLFSVMFMSVLVVVNAATSVRELFARLMMMLVLVLYVRE